MLIFVDCEAYGGSPVTGRLTEFGAVSYPKLDTFHGIILNSIPDPSNPAIPQQVNVAETTYLRSEKEVFTDFAIWLKEICGKEQPVFVSDNVAFDWQWISCGFHRALGENPFGHSGRRISDFYAGLTHKWSNTQRWKKYRVTKHDHNPVHDALGNAEAYRTIMSGLEHGTYGEYK